MYLLSLALFVACGPPLEEGTYALTIADVEDDTCGLDDETLGVGDTELAVLEWTDSDTFTLSGDSDLGAEYDYDGGGSFSRDDSVSAEIADPCYLRQDFAFDGEVFSSSSFVVHDAVDFSTEGDCSDFDTTGLPCSVTVSIEGELRE